MSTMRMRSSSLPAKLDNSIVARRFMEIPRSRGLLNELKLLKKAIALTVLPFEFSKHNSR